MTSISIFNSRAASCRSYKMDLNMNLFWYSILFSLQMFNSLPFLLCKYRSIATYRYACSLIGFFLCFFLSVSPMHFNNVTTDFIFYYFVLCLLCLKRPQMPWEIRFSNGENPEGEREGGRGSVVGRLWRQNTIESQSY